VLVIYIGSKPDDHKIFCGAVPMCINPLPAMRCSASSFASNVANGNDSVDVALNKEGPMSQQFQSPGPHPLIVLMEKKTAAASKGSDDETLHESFSDTVCSSIASSKPSLDLPADWPRREISHHSGRRAALRRSRAQVVVILSMTTNMLLR
jgi:hypothetical protein